MESIGGIDGYRCIAIRDAMDYKEHYVANGYKIRPSQLPYNLRCRGSVSGSMGVNDCIL